MKTPAQIPKQKIFKSEVTPFAGQCPNEKTNCQPLCRNGKRALQPRPLLGSKRSPCQLPRSRRVLPWPIKVTLSKKTSRSLKSAAQDCCTQEPKKLCRAKGAGLPSPSPPPGKLPSTGSYMLLNSTSGFCCCSSCSGTLGAKWRKSCACRSSPSKSKSICCSPKRGRCGTQPKPSKWRCSHNTKKGAFQGVFFRFNNSVSFADLICIRPRNIMAGIARCQRT